MPIVKKTLEENYIFFIRELSRIDSQIKDLPVGSISAKKIGNSTYHYHQWREGKKVRSVSLGKEVPPELIDGISRRKTLEVQRKEILDNINVIVKAIDIQRVTVEEILRLFSDHGIRVTLIGSYCIPVYKSQWKMNLPTMRTQDVDFLVQVPYKGKIVDIESLIGDLGFSIGFNADGSTYFTNGVFKVEFLTPEKGRGTNKAVQIKQLKIGAMPLRYLQMLLEEQVSLKMDDYTVSIPKPWVFAFHKILITKNRKDKGKKEKDMLQAVSILREIAKRPDDAKEAQSYLKTLPKPWVKHIKEQLATRLPDFGQGNDV